MNAATAHASTGTDWVTLLIDYWWLALIFGGGILDFIAETFGVGVGALRRRSKLKHKRRMELARVQLQIAQAQAGGTPAPMTARKPGPCVHRNVAAVVSTDDEVVGWLCRSCDAQLPADWAVREEDL